MNGLQQLAAAREHGRLLHELWVNNGRGKLLANKIDTNFRASGTLLVPWPLTREVGKHPLLLVRSISRCAASDLACLNCLREPD
jgi:hypothetical protein